MSSGMSERVAGGNDTSEAIVRPRIGTPIALALLSVFLGYIGAMALWAGGLRHAWWAAAVPWLLAGLAATGAFRSLRTRSLLVLRVTPERFIFGDATVRQFQVTGVRRFKDLRFKGVRVDLGSERWLAIPAHLFVPSRVLAVFRSRGYPVE
jgi:hypothetical protein